MTKKLFIFIGLVIALLLANSVLAYTKSAAFNQVKDETKITRVGISAGEFAPKQPRFITNITIIKSVIIPFPGIRTVSFEEQMQREAEAKEAAKKAGEEEEQDKRTADEKEKKEQEAREVEESAFAKKAAEALKQLEDEKRKNTKEATLSVKSSKMKDMRVSPKAGSVISLAIILGGLLIYLSVKITGLKHGM